MLKTLEDTSVGLFLLTSTPNLTCLLLLLLAYHPIQGAQHVRCPTIFSLAYTPGPTLSESIQPSILPYLCRIHLGSATGGPNDNYIVQT